MAEVRTVESADQRGNLNSALKTVCVCVVVVGCFRLSNKAHNIVLLSRVVVGIKHGYLECTWRSAWYVVSSTNRLV